MLKASAKLIKKDEQKMTTGNNYGKLPLYSMSGIKLLFIPFILLGLSVSLSASSKEKRWTVVIDAGHGGRDPGAVGAITYEKNITLAVALKTGQYIEENAGNINVIYTRKTDIFIDIKERAEIANRNNADLFISIHANSGKSKSTVGTETFIMGLAKDEQNLAVAMKENEVILLENDHSAKYEGFDPKSPESYIMFTLMQNVFQEQSTGLASKIQSEYKDKLKRVDRGVKQAGFWVLFMTTMPSVLTETGFITNPEEEKFLNSKKGQDYLSSSIYRAIRDYFAEIESKSIMVTENNQYVTRETNNSKTEQSSLKTDTNRSRQEQSVIKKEPTVSKSGQPIINKEQQPEKPGQSVLKTKQQGAATDTNASKPQHSPSKTDKAASKSEQPVLKTDTAVSSHVKPLGEEIIFRVLINASAVKLPLNTYISKGLKDITEFKIQDKYYYTTGSFSDYSPSVRYRKKIETIFPDAFVIAFKGNKILPLQQAIELLKK